MILLFDMNFIFDFFWDGVIIVVIDEQFNLSVVFGIFVILVVLIGELNVLVLKCNWGFKWVESIFYELNKFLVIFINIKDVF